ncbi:hypothetical protein [Haloferula sp. BvORR071]|uniref:hypothetical protein n=1 Tax=Haloferula sp. BvORR071 TaxID=1396141 RepID=UPI00054FC326|nr:hypothetical protein [Haloferula sp. BvORR071]
MKTSTRIITHAAAVAVGIALAAAIATKPAEASGSAEASLTERATASRESQPGRTVAARKPKAEDYRRAWQAVAAKEHNILDRRSLQLSLLARWAEVDLQGALEAAMAEAWDNDYNPGFAVYGTAGHVLIDAFGKAFQERPLEAWALISSGRFGAGSAILREQWITSLAKRDGGLVLSMLGEMPPGKREFAINAVMNEAETNPAKMKELLAKLVANGSGAQTEDWLKIAAAHLPDGGDPAALREEWAALPEGAPRTLALMTWAASLKRADAATLRSEWERIPEEQRGEAAKAIYLPMNAGSPELMTAMSLVMQAGEWDFLKDKATDDFRFYAMRADPVKMAEWALDLPERPETVEFFHRAVDRYIGDDMPRAKDWLEAMEPGDWHRERGLAEYSQQALRRHDDPEGSRWALDQITDPALKKMAEGWRGDWEKEKGTR